MENEKLNNGVTDLEGEVWKVINHPSIGDYSNYEISNKGRVKSRSYRKTGREKLLKVGNNGRGYSTVVLCGKKPKTFTIQPKTFTIHRLVALAFIPNPDPNNPLEVNNLQINHIDENKSNNCVENLEWCTAAYNINYGTCIDRMKETIKTSIAFKEGVKKSTAKRSKTVYQYDQNYQLLKIYPSTRGVERDTNFDHTIISDCCRANINLFRTTKPKISYGFIWSYEPITKVS